MRDHGRCPANSRAQVGCGAAGAPGGQLGRGKMCLSGSPAAASPRGGSPAPANPHSARVSSGPDRANQVLISASCSTRERRRRRRGRSGPRAGRGGRGTGAGHGSGSNLPVRTRIASRQRLLWSSGREAIRRTPAPPPARGVLAPGMPTPAHDARGAPSYGPDDADGHFAVWPEPW